MSSSTHTPGVAVAVTPGLIDRAEIERTIPAESTCIALICPTMWDEAELPHIVSRGRYQIRPYGTDVSEHPEDFDALGFIEEAAAEFRKFKIDGVMASDDYPGSILAAAIAQRLGHCRASMSGGSVLVAVNVLTSKRTKLTGIRRQRPAAFPFALFPGMTAT